MGINYKKEVLQTIKSILSKKTIDDEVLIVPLEEAQSKVWIGPGENNKPCLYARGQRMYHDGLISSPEGVVKTLESEGRIVEAYENLLHKN